MKYRLVILFLLIISAFEIKADVDPKFQIYLCFGQSNMSGGSPAETVDMEYVDSRFLVLATDTTYKNPVRKMGEWSTAYPPIVSGGATLCPADYFGRSMVAALPSDYRVGVVAVAAGGLNIKAFFKGSGTTYIDWPEAPQIKKYGSDFYGRLVEMAKIAKKSGVIKGILMHQGEANLRDSLEWAEWVRTIYDNLIFDLGLDANEVPLLVGEVVDEAEGGQCYKHNKTIAKVPEVLPIAHVVSSAGCPAAGDPGEKLHFTALGYRILGKRYATKMLELLGYPAQKDADYQLPEGLRKFYSATKFKPIADITLQPNETYVIPDTVFFEDGHKEPVSEEAVVTCTGEGLKVSGNKLTAITNERSLVVVSYTDFTGKTISTKFYVNRTGTQGPVLRANDYTREYGEPNPVFDYTIESGSISGAPQLTCEATETSPVGMYPIKMSRGSMAEDNADFFYGTLTVTKAPLTIMAKSFARVVGYPNPSLEVTYDGFKNGETEDVLTHKPTITTTATQESQPGTYDINDSDAEAQNYTINYVNGTLTVVEKKLGDVNADTVVDEKDLKAIVEFIMGKIPEGNFDVDLANVNQDSRVDAADVVALINLIVQTSNNE